MHYTTSLWYGVVVVDGRDMNNEDINAYLVNVFQMLLSSEKFKVWLNDNYLISHTLDEENQKLIRVSIVEKTPEGGV